MVSSLPRNNPFPGLRPFTLDEEHLFFGREGQADELLHRLDRSRFLAVVGTSGSGKSSLVRAGLLPSLYSGFLKDASSGWRVAILRPGNAPIANLAAALNQADVFGVAPTSDEAIIRTALTESTLRRGALGLVEIAQQARMEPDENLLVVVDQFEELFRFKQQSQSLAAEDEAAAFVKLLLAAVNQQEVPIFVVLTMRSDFLGDCAQFRDLPETLNDSQYLIPRLTRAQLRRAIEGPVAVGGATIIPRLVNRLLNDTGDNPDQLPILQHALMRTWDHWEDQQTPQAAIDLEHYEAIGGMAQALSRHADQIYNQLPDDSSRQIAEIVFKRLTDRGADNRDIRRPTPLAEICAVADASPEAVLEVIDQFRAPRRSFLMPPARVLVHDSTVIDISHESLMRNWQRLRDWIAEEAQSASIFRRLAETAALNENEKAGFLQDPELSIVENWWKEQKPNEAWAKRYTKKFATVQHYFSFSSRRELERRAKLESSRKKEIIRLRNASIRLGFLALFASFSAIAAVHQQRLAARQAKLAKEKTEEANLQRQRAETLASELERYTSETLNLVSQAAQDGRSASDIKSEIENQNLLLQEEATKVIDGWLSSKPKIFGPPYNGELARSFLTGNALDSALGAVQWLKSNGYFYKYKFSRIDSVSNFIPGPERSIIDLVLEEELVLYDSSGNAVTERSGRFLNTYRYTLNFEDGSWKISDYEAL